MTTQPVVDAARLPAAAFRLPLSRFRLLFRMPLLEFGQAALLRLVRRGVFTFALRRLLQPVLFAACDLDFQPLTF